MTNSKAVQEDTCISYPLLLDKLSQNLVASNHMHLLSHTVSGGWNPGAAHPGSSGSGSHKRLWSCCWPGLQASERLSGPRGFPSLTWLWAGGLSFSLNVGPCSFPRGLSTELPEHSSWFPEKMQESRKPWCLL